MHFKSPIFLIAILGASLVAGLVFGVSFMKERWEPCIESIDNLPVDPSKTEFTFGGSYLDEKCQCRCMIYTSWSAKRFRVTIERFSEELQVLDRDTTVEAVPYVLQEGNLGEHRCIWLGFTVVMPNQTGTYEVDLSIRMYSWLFFSKEYKFKYTLSVEPQPSKPPPEEPLTIVLDKETYNQGDIMNITIKNVSNATLWFTDTAYSLFFERFNGVNWEFHTAIVGCLAMTSLESGETAELTWKLDTPGQPFPPGQYRVGTNGVYAEFEVT